ncbi:hypothetical protein Ahy_B05g075632 [Arachis hypogaea]|uniref:Uncharacterized protein n=1 Tax=Arachis hypogaea TaxID=3818 RepID=A0A444Z1L4_ARAHY|nr:hypothetical protein Ahy_B05g075632 [Arachis hypogaea]
MIIKTESGCPVQLGKLVEPRANKKTLAPIRLTQPPPTATTAAPTALQHRVNLIAEWFSFCVRWRRLVIGSRVEDSLPSPLSRSLFSSLSLPSSLFSSPSAPSSLFSSPSPSRSFFYSSLPSSSLFVAVKLPLCLSIPSSARLEDEDYDPEADEVPSFDDHIDDLFVAQEVEGQHNNGKRKDTDFWEVTVIVILFPIHFLEDGVRKASRMSVKEAIALPSNTKIVLPFNKELQSIGQAAGLFSGFLRSLGADYSQFPICADSWKHVNKAKKEHAYDLIKRVFHYEDDAGEKIKCDIMKRIGKNWKDTRHHLYDRCYKEIRTYEKNLEHRSKGIVENEWKKFIDYCQKEETKEKEQGRLVGRGELFILTHKKKDGSYIHPDARVVSEAIANVERQDGSSRHLSQNDSLAQVLEKEHPGQVHALGARPCPTQVFGNAAGQLSGSAEPNEKYERRIAELTAKLEEEQTKRQSIHKVLRYLVQQQGGNLPAEVAAELAFLGGTPNSSCAGPSSSGNHDPQQKF